jgi:hypothetical protein
MTIGTSMPNILTRVQTKTACARTQKGQQQKAPQFTRHSMIILNFGHSKLRANLTMHHYREPGMIGLPRVIFGGWLVHEDYFVGEGAVHVGGCLLYL